MSEQPIRSSLSGTTSMWSHSLDHSSGTSTPVVTSLSTPTLYRPSATNSANGGPLLPHSHRESQSHHLNNPGIPQNQSPMSAVSTAHNVQVGYPDKGNQTAVSHGQSIRKFASAAIPIVRPSPASAATVGAIGDGRKRIALGNSNNSDGPAPAEVEQTLVLLRSLDITPPLSVQSVDSSITTPASQVSVAERPRLHIDPYGQYSNSVDQPYPRRSLFDPFFDSADTPATQSPATPGNDQFDLLMSFNPLPPFDVGEGGFLSRHGSQEPMGKPCAFPGALSREFDLTPHNGTVNNHPPRTLPPTNTRDESSLAIRGSQAFFVGRHGSHGSFSSLAANSASALNPDGGNPAHAGAQKLEAPLASPASRADTQFFRLHEPTPYLRSPSPYWRYLPTLESESLPQVPRSLTFGDVSVKQDDWVTSFGSNQDVLKPEQKNGTHLPGVNDGHLDGPWTSGIAPWTPQQYLLNERVSQSQSMGMSSVSGHPNDLVLTGIPQMAPLPFSSRAPASHAASVQGYGTLDASARNAIEFHHVPIGTSVWAQTNGTESSHAISNVSPPKDLPSVGSNANASYPSIPSLLPLFASTPTSGSDSRVRQLLPQSRNLESSQARVAFSQPRFGGLGLEEDENINFLQLLQPDAKPPYNVLVNRIVRKSDQQASIFIQQKLKNASVEERSRIVNAIVERGLDMMQGRFGNWCVQRCLEGPCSRENRMKIVECMTGHIVELATNCYGTHVVQKALECEEDIKRIIVNELLDNDPAFTLTSKHCSHVWAKVMELSWYEGPVPPIFRVVNQSLRGKWASLACHETGSLVVQTMFENMDEVEDKRIIVDEILDNLDDVVKNQWGAFVIQHIIEHGNAAVSHRTSLSLINNMAIYGTHDIAVKSILKILKEKNPMTQDAAVTKMCEPNVNPNRNKRPIIVDLALSSNGSQIIQAILPDANKDQRARLYEAVKGHTVTLRGCKTGSRVIWLFDRMRAYYGY